MFRHGVFRHGGESTIGSRGAQVLQPHWPHQTDVMPFENTRPPCSLETAEKAWTPRGPHK